MVIRYTQKELENMNICKGDLLGMMGLKFDGNVDTAIPQQWLNKFIETTGLNYNLVTSTTFMVYGKQADVMRQGRLISACDEVQRIIDGY